MAPVLGVSQWFSFEDREAVAAAVNILTDLQVTELRTLFSWADWSREDGPAWFDWFIGELAKVPDLRLLPALFYTPPSIARKDSNGEQKTSYPPEDLSSYSYFVRDMIERYGAHFDWVQLWNEGNWDAYWSWDMDPAGDAFAPMVREAADVAHELGKKVFLGGTTPLDFSWSARMSEKGLLAKCDAIGFHYSPSWPHDHRRWQPFETELHALQALLRGLGESCEIWLDETGFSTKTKQDQDEKKLEQEQPEYFDWLQTTSVDRVYWYTLFDEADDAVTDDDVNMGIDPGCTVHHFGLVRVNGSKKPLYEHWQKRNQEL